MFRNLQGHGAQFIKSLIILVGIAGMALPAKAEIIHFNSLDLTQARSKDLGDPYERRFTAANDMEITSIELKLSETRDSASLAFRNVTISINDIVFTYSSHDAVAGTITLIGYAALSAGDVATVTIGGTSIFGRVHSSDAHLNGLGAHLQRDDGWQFKAKTDWQDYKTGYIAGVNLSFGYRF